ncbi:formimidoylglutamate deiminase [Sphingopyxis macrogoltabida]|uniref:N-formimino-L-glutamate deiminase n=1 Tax=Sphingopyxis macrogoltabida TaxID=33050 RepID=A0AAC9FF87_SPHMC|nr:formimidoylglutamate deiminase [Sphingopyxis macrogoltabida]ALJ13938.1 N-formimino-L-glutamate deiminase [Sphingopyxis macrogoltabida]AMU88625.1 N-formimino-L-glutamate deiminase [Sphingopyxis macrogoltabida]
MNSAQQTDDLHLFFDHMLLPAGFARGVRLTIRDGLIAAVESDAAPRPGDERHGCGVPGMPNLHSHAFQRGMAGLAERRGPSGDSFWTWREVMYRFLGRMTPDDLRAVAALAYMEMLEGGFTRVGEFHYLHHDIGGAAFADPAEMSRAIVAAADESGIALTLLPVLYSYAGFGAQAPQPAQMRFVMDLDRYARLLDGADAAARGLPDAIVGIAPHSLRAVSPDQLAALAGIGAGRPVHIHIAEQVKEVADCLDWSGQRPVEWLLGHAAVDKRWCLVHATHMTPDESEALAKSGAIAGLCPITEANLGDGLFPAETFLAAGGRFGVGSDSNVLIDVSEELRLLEYGQRLLHRGRNMLARGEGRSTGADIYAAAVDGGAAALGVTGGLTVGAPADIVGLDLSHPSLAGKAGDALLDAYVFAAGRSAIDSVWRRGERLVERGRHRQRARIIERYAATLDRLTA